MSFDLTRRTFLAGSGLLAVSKTLLVPAPAWAAVAKVGTAAPAFSAGATTGKSVSLADYQGKIVVLEWTNHLCPYVQKHYETSNMQALQKDVTELNRLLVDNGLGRIESGQPIP